MEYTILGFWGLGSGAGPWGRGRQETETMLILALDTTTRSGSIALARDERLLAVMAGDPAKPHAERLPADIVRMLAEQHLDLTAIDVFGVAAGPGSFTGLRIGIAAVQGLAFAMNRPVVPVSTLDALAHVGAEAWRNVRDPEPGVDGARATPDAGRDDRVVAAFMDAQRSEVFAALYRVTGPPASPAFEVLDGPVSQPPAIVLERWSGEPAGEIWIAGDGVARYRELLVEHLGPRCRPVDPLPPLAPTIARIAAREASAGRAVAPHAIRPLYVRRPDAELARERTRTSAGHQLPRRP